MSKLPNVGTTIFSIMSAKSIKYKAINLSQGFPDFDIDEELRLALIDAAKDNSHQYRPLAGDAKLLEKTTELIKYKYSREINADEILICAGATQAIYTSITALVHKDDEVIILDPAYDCYEPPVLLCGAKAVRVPLNEAYLPDWNKIREACNEKTKILIINNPHNPSGKVWEKAEFEALEKLMTAFPNLLLMSDEVYEFISFEKKHISAHALRSFHDRIIVISSYGKTFHITGWKIGYLVAPTELMKEIKKVHQFTVFCVNSVAQVALGNYIENDRTDSLGDFYKEKRDFFKNAMHGSRFKFLPSEGTYFQVLDYSEISNLNDVEFCNLLVEKHGVAAIPISVFNELESDKKHIRICFAKKNETLLKAAEILCKI